MEISQIVTLALYILIFTAFLIIAFLSREEPFLASPAPTGIEAVLRRMSVYLYRKICGRWKRKFEDHLHLFSAEAVQNDLMILYPSSRPGREEARYQIGKIQLFLTFLAAGTVLGFALWISEWQQAVIQADGTILRPDYQEEAISVTAKATGREDEETLDLGKYDIVVESRLYSEEQAEEMAEELLRSLPERVKGENQSLSYVTENIVLERKVEGYPFQISWESSSYELIDTDGTVRADRVTSGEPKRVSLTAILRYETMTWQQEYEVLVFPISMSEEQKRNRSIEEELSKEEEQSAQKDRIQLPSVIDGIAVQWTEQKEEVNLTLFLLITVAGILAAVGKDQELHRTMQKREREMALDYPLVVSKMTLFLGAGMSIRNIFYRLGEEYMRKCRKGGDKRYVYEEILLVCRELDNGISETAACIDFGKRCRSSRYSKLSALLTANLTKGNGALLKALQEEADRSFEERRAIARQMGEEAGTRLLLPMLMMLGITLVIIMVPAYFSFSL